MLKNIGVAVICILICCNQIQALNTIKGSLYINDQLRAKEVIVDPLQAQFTSQKHFSLLMQQEGEPNQENLDEHQQNVDQASSGIISNNMWCENCQLNNLKVNDKLIGESLTVNVIKGARNTEDTSLDGAIYILGDLTISDKESESDPSNLNINLLQAKTISINGVKQWTLLDSDSFSFSKQQSNSTLLQNGWKIIKSDDSSAKPLKTNDEEIAQGSLNEKIVKNFEDIPEHTHLKIEGNFFFMSPFWKGESAQIRVNGKIVWLDSHSWTENMMSGITDICSLQMSDLNQYIWVQPISFIVKHKLSSFQIELGLTKTINELFSCTQYKDKLDQIPLFGFDDFSLYIK